eukprot:snap_masked-scaffold_46-processed-gene-1.15-mRNA-1 protein AED:1.00 eAED:1.00 QI:0/-1/0/0/-1/1/1/0/92
MLVKRLVAERVTFIEVLDHNQWISVPGCLDSDAGRTLERVSMHRQYYQTSYPVFNNLCAKLANKQMVSVVEKIEIYARVGFYGASPVNLRTE